MKSVKENKEEGGGWTEKAGNSIEMGGEEGR